MKRTALLFLAATIVAGSLAGASRLIPSEKKTLELSRPSSWFR